MGLFDQIVGAINNPNQQASPDQIGMLLNTVQQFAGNQGIDPGTTQAVLSVVGSHIRSALQQQQATAGTQQTAAIVNQYSGMNPSTAAVQAIFSPQQQQQVSQDAAQRTGLNAQTIQALLPIVVPIVLQLLQSGATNQSGQPSQPGQGSNTVLNSFLDSDNDGDVDVGDAFSLASRFLNQPR